MNNIDDFNLHSLFACERWTFWTRQKAICVVICVTALAVCHCCAVFLSRCPLHQEFSSKAPRANVRVDVALSAPRIGFGSTWALIKQSMSVHDYDVDIDDRWYCMTRKRRVNRSAISDVSDGLYDTLAKFVLLRCLTLFCVIENIVYFI